MKTSSPSCWPARGASTIRASARRFSQTVKTEAFRASLGRIACGYDGGQVIQE